MHSRAAIAPGGTNKKAVRAVNGEQAVPRELLDSLTGDAQLETLNERESRGINLCRAITRCRRLCGRQFSAGTTIAIEQTTQTLPRAAGGRYVHLNLLWVRACIEEDRYSFKITADAPCFKSFRDIPSKLRMSCEMLIVFHDLKECDETPNIRYSGRILLRSDPEYMLPQPRRPR